MKDEMTIEEEIERADQIFEEVEEMDVPHGYEVHDVDKSETYFTNGYSKQFEAWAETEQVIVWWQKQMREELAERLREVKEMDTGDLVKLSEFGSDTESE